MPSFKCKSCNVTYDIASPDGPRREVHRVYPWYKDQKTGVQHFAVHCTACGTVHDCIDAKLANLMARIFAKGLYEVVRVIPGSEVKAMDDAKLAELPKLLQEELKGKG